eukprot:scaffold202689_cov27-Tisochrysis_lutea.AAC.1
MGSWPEPHSHNASVIPELYSWPGHYPDTPAMLLLCAARKEMGLTDTKTKKLSANALRTMESVYARTPFPSSDVIDGLWDLHKISRETALQWFIARRAQDGILSSEQKRRAKDPAKRESTDERCAALSSATAGQPES